MRVENAFDVPAGPEAAWEVLNDVPRVVPCMPGAELNEVVDDDTFKVTMHVKLGAVALRLASDVRRERADESTRTTVLAVRARDEKGRGGATATIESSLEPNGAGTHVKVVTDLQMQGTLASMGRGVVGAVAAELVSRFAERLGDELRSEPATPASAPAEPEPVAAAPAAAPVEAVGGFGLLVRAFWRRLLGR
jgi:hypothetical protein